MVDFLEIDLFDAVGAEGLHAGGAGHGGCGDDLGLAAFEEGAEVDFCVEHEFLAAFAVCPEIGGCVEAGCEAVIGGGDDAVVMVKGSGTDFPVGILGAEAGDVGERHGVLGYAEAAFGHAGSSKFRLLLSRIECAACAVAVLGIIGVCDGKCEGDDGGGVCFRDLGGASDLLETFGWAASDVDRGAAHMLDVSDVVAVTLVEEGWDHGRCANLGMAFPLRCVDWRELGAICLGDSK